MRKYFLRISPALQSFIRHLHPGIKTKIKYALEEIISNPRIGKCLKPPLNPFYSYRISNYRIIYEIKEKEIVVVILDIATRDIVYSRVAKILGILSENRKAEKEAVIWEENSDFDDWKN